MSNEEIKRAILEMDEREELAKDMLEQVSAAEEAAEASASSTSSGVVAAAEVCPREE